MDNQDFEAWEPEPVPRGFAERVVEAARRERTARQRRRRAGVAATILLAAAAAVAVILGRPYGATAPASGEARAAVRSEIAIGARIAAVLEPGARLKWSSAEVEQPAGDVFYRVERGAPLRVHTPAG